MGTGKLGDHHALVDKGGVVLLKGRGPSGVKGSVYIGAQALGVAQHIAALVALQPRQILNKVFQIAGVQPGVAVRAGLLFICQHGNAGVLRRLADAENGLQGRIGAHTVVVAVAADQGAVKAQVVNGKGRHQLQLGRQQISLHNAVFLVQQIEDIELHLFAGFVVLKGAGADDNVQLFPFDQLVDLAGVLLQRQVGQNVRNTELGVTRLLAQAHIHIGAVVFANAAVERQGNGGPLVLFNTAVVVGLKQCQPVVLVHRALL